MQPLSPGLLDDHVRALGPRVRLALTATASRNRSPDARQLLARAALGDHATLDQLLAAARAGDRRWLRRLRRKVDPAMVAAVAQAIALQELRPEERADALALYELVRAAFGQRALTPANRTLHIQLALAAEGPDRARRLLWRYALRFAAGPGGRRVRQARSLAADVLNPFASGGPIEPWQRVFRTLLPVPGPTVADGEGVPFDRLSTEAVERVDSPHRISVVVTAFRPDRGLLTAVRSILAQSWANVEVVIVDDASPPSFDGVLDAAVALGGRIRLVKLPVNAGTYAARNAGLDAAQGEFAAFQDSDDWSHPRRLEWQVRPLLDDRKLVATTSDGLAVTDDLALSRPGVRSGRFNPSSLVFRRARVLREAGYFDRLRKAADSEYIGRIQAVFGARRVRHLQTPPLALIRLSAGSLSRSEIRAHWMHPARTAYISAYQRWHRRIAAGQARAYRPADGTDRPFPAPDHLLGVVREKAYDVVMVADWRFLETAHRTALDEIRALTAAGMRVAVAHLESYRAVFLRRQTMCAPIQDLVNDGVVDRVDLAEPVGAALVMVRQAAVLQFTGGITSGIRARRVAVVADRAPQRADGTDRRYEPSACSAAARRLFGEDPEWLIQDDGLRSCLRTGNALLPTALAAPPWAADRRAAVPGPAVVGTDLCDAANWPADPAESLAVFRRLADADVRVRLPDRPRDEFPVPLAHTWLGFEVADVDARPFLHQLDFYLHFPPRESVEWYARPALEAAAMGCVVVMPERYAAFYGDAAVYCGRSEAGPLIARYRADPALFAEQSRRARQVVASAYDPARFVDRIKELLPVTATATPALPKM